GGRDARGRRLGVVQADVGAAGLTGGAAAGGQRPVEEGDVAAVGTHAGRGAAVAQRRGRRAVGVADGGERVRVVAVVEVGLVGAVVGAAVRGERVGGGQQVGRVVGEGDVTAVFADHRPGGLDGAQIDRGDLVLRVVAGRGGVVGDVADQGVGVL